MLLTIQASLKPILDEKLEKLIIKAHKLNCAPPSFTYGAAYNKTEIVETVGENNSSTFKQVTYLAIDVTLIATPIVLSGWEFIASLSHLCGETIISSLSEKECPKNYLSPSRNGVCDHCGINRQRNTTYIVKHEDGTFKQVGSSCITDFLGGHHAVNAIALATFQTLVIETFRDVSEAPLGGNQQAYGVDYIIAVTAAIVSENGWRSSKAAHEQGGTATHSLVSEAIRDKEFSPSKENWEEAASIILWAKELSDEECENSYFHNLRAFARVNMLTSYKHMGIVCSMFAAYKGMMQAKVDVAKPSSHVGVVGKRESFILTLKFIREFSSTYGITSLHMFEDTDGNIIVWKASGTSNLKHGEQYKLKGTIKEHSFYREKAQTILTRCKVE